MNNLKKLEDEKKQIQKEIKEIELKKEIQQLKYNKFLIKLGLKK